MTTRKSWERDPKYAYLESNPDPNFRPKLSALIDKLKQLKLLQNNPTSVEFLINALSYHYFMHEKERPVELFRQVERSYQRWRLALGFTGHDTPEEVERMQESAGTSKRPPKSPTGDAVSESQSFGKVRGYGILEVIVEEDHLFLTIRNLPGSFIWGGKEGEEQPTPKQVMESLSPYLVQAGVSASDGSDVAGTGGLGRRSPLKIGEEVQARIQATLLRHNGRDEAGSSIKVACGCSKKFSSTRKWAKHVTKRMVKAIEGFNPALTTVGEAGPEKVAPIKKRRKVKK